MGSGQKQDEATRIIRERDVAIYFISFASSHVQRQNPVQACHPLAARKVQIYNS